MELINKVAQSGLITLDLEKLLSTKEICPLDISQFLFRGLILKEKEFRTAVKEYDWSRYKGKICAVHCSVEAIIPQWAYMLIASALQEAESDAYFGTIDEVKNNQLIQAIRQLDEQPYLHQKVVIKGCGGIPLPDAAFLEITKRLRPIVKSLMFGEPCSTVPVYKSKS